MNIKRKKKTTKYWSKSTKKKTKIWSLSLKDFKKKCKIKAQSVKLKTIFLQNYLKNKQIPILQIHDQASWMISQNRN